MKGQHTGKKLASAQSPRSYEGSKILNNLTNNSYQRMSDYLDEKPQKRHKSRKKHEITKLGSGDNLYPTPTIVKS